MGCFRNFCFDRSGRISKHDGGSDSEKSVLNQNLFLYREKAMEKMKKEELLSAVKDAQMILVGIGREFSMVQKASGEKKELAL